MPKSLRKENIICDLFQTKLSDFLFSNLMEWNIYYCILGCLIDENNKVKEKFFNQREVIKRIEDEYDYNFYFNFYFYAIFCLYMILLLLKYMPIFIIIHQKLYQDNGH